MEKRYFYYLFSINQVSNIALFVPSILYISRFEGAVTSMLLAVLAGTLLAGLYLHLSEMLPQETLPELMKSYLPGWASAGLRFAMVLIWYWVGLIALLFFVKITHRFFDPDASEYLILTAYLMLIIGVARLPSRSILLGLEVLIVINVPLLVGFLGKLLTQKQVNWDGPMDIVTHAFHMPELDALAAATFVFSGYANMVVFQKAFAEPVGFKFFWYVPMAGTASLLLGFFIPILYHGTEAVGSFNFPWIATADSVRMEFFIVERMVFVFLFIYISISLLSIIVHWHVALESAYSFLTAAARGWRKWRPQLVYLAFAAVAYGLVGRVSEKSLMEQSQYFMIVRFLGEILLVAVLGYMVKRGRGRAA